MSNFGLNLGLGLGPESSPTTAAAPPPAAPTFQALGASANVASVGTLQVNWPAHVAGDIGILICATDDGTGVQAFSDAQGFVEVTDSPKGTGGATGTRLHAYWCRATSDAMTGPTFADVASDGQKICSILTFRGCVATGNPWDVTAGDVLAVADTAVSIPGDTTTKDNCLILAICSHGVDSAAGGQFSNWANASLESCDERVDRSTTSGAGAGFGAATGVKATAGVVSATTATLLASEAQAHLMIALRSY